MNATQTSPAKKICSIEGCLKEIHSRSWCSSHYSRWWKYGDPLSSAPDKPRKNPARKSLEERFWEKVDQSGNCWNWKAGLTSEGYGQIFIEGPHSGKAHRVSYEIHFGRIPEGQEIDHKCHNRKCVNPSHLRAVHRKQNTENHSGARVDSSTGVRGVHPVPGSRRFQAIVNHNKIRHYLGTFATIAEAEKAVIAKRNELHTHNDLDRI